MAAGSTSETNTANRVAVIGAGPAGLAAAYQLAKAGVAVDLYEASGQVGGLSKSIELWGRRVDLGPHRFFSRDPRVNQLWLEVVGKDYHMVERLTRIYYNGKLFYYPLQASNALRRIGPWEALRSIWSYGLQKISPVRDDGSFENWVVRRFGRRLFELFFKSYSEKLWGIPTSQLDADFAAQRIKKLSLSSAIANAFSSQSGSKHTTLVDRFAYPKGGTGSVYERMAIDFEALGGRLFLNTPV
ncbi:MAG: FAD-dependent oxidoreductase, partial [Bacteroidota bacterium]